MSSSMKLAHRVTCLDMEKYAPFLGFASELRNHSKAKLTYLQRYRAFCMALRRTVEDRRSFEKLRLMFKSVYLNQYLRHNLPKDARSPSDLCELSGGVPPPARPWPALDGHAAACAARSRPIPPARPDPSREDCAGGAYASNADSRFPLRPLPPAPCVPCPKRLKCSKCQAPSAPSANRQAPHAPSVPCAQKLQGA